MRFRKIILYGILLVQSGCSQMDRKEKESVPATIPVKAIPAPVSNIKPDTSNQHIYNFMEVVIADRKLDKNYGVGIEPEKFLYHGKDDRAFLSTLLIKKTQKTDKDDWKTVSLTQLPQCLTQADIAYMLKQKESPEAFTWDKSRLGFKGTDTTNWYSFSRPLFSKDGREVVIQVESLCPGLCGTGELLMFIKEGDKWTSHRGPIWVH
jgi:hypothetical protein